MRGRGQASVEFLSTYAWAMLGLIIALAALSILGVFNMNSYQKDACESGSQISCEDFYFATDDQGDSILLMKFQNNYDKEIVIDAIEVEGFSQASRELIRVFPGRTITVSFYSNEDIYEEYVKESFPFSINFRRYEGINQYTVEGNVQVTAHSGEVALESAGGESFLQGEQYCGDGIAQEELGEECDPPTLIDTEGYVLSDDCDGFHSCLSDCSCGGSCGDGIVSGTEQCETSNDCSFGYYCLSCECFEEDTRPILT